MRPILLSAHNPMTGPRHLGHLFSTMADWPTLEEKYDLYIVIDDLIASILYPSGRKHVQDRTFNVAREFLATGIDPRRSRLVLTSMLPEIHELTFFMGDQLEFQWVRQLYSESFCGLLGSFQRQELGMPRLASVTELVYPQVALAGLTLGLGADAFQGGEEMRGYLHIMDAICEKAGRNWGLRKPQFLAGKSTFVLGIDGKHMASENAVYLSSSVDDLKKAVARVKSADVFENWYGALGKADLAKRIEEPIGPKTSTAMLECLVDTLKPFREFRVSNSEIVAVLEESALPARELLSKTLAAIKREYGIPGY
jgi:tryptophanyl-tRNA synthetase